MTPRTVEAIEIGTGVLIGVSVGAFTVYHATGKLFTALAKRDAKKRRARADELTLLRQDPKFRESMEQLMRGQTLPARLEEEEDE